MKVVQNIKNGKWWNAACMRAVKTVVQAAIACIGTAAVLSQVDWQYTISAAILAGILSILTSLAGLPEVAGAETAEETDETAAG